MVFVDSRSGGAIDFFAFETGLHECNSFYVFGLFW